MHDNYLSKFNRVLEEALAITTKKHNDYGNSTWNKYGLKMRFADIWRKFARLESLVWNNNKAMVKDESVRDTLLDLLVYSVMAIMVYDEEANRNE